jgi:uncharacterized protein (TIGR03085 family)
MTNYARDERNLLCDLFLEVGPDAPTLCGDWTTRDLAAHLYVRERRPDSAAGILLAPLREYGEKVRKRVAARPWEALVADVRSGPPLWNPTRLAPVDRVANTVEFFVHHEDVRRAVEPWEPRSLDPELDAALTAALKRMGRLLVRSAPAGLVFVPPKGERIVAKKGEPIVEVHGEAGELLLFAYGRQAHSRVALEGPDDLIAATRTARFGV